MLLESPLDRIDPYLAFRDSFKSKSWRSRVTTMTVANISTELQEEQPQFCATLLTHLTPADQTALLEVCRRADTQEMMGLQSPFPISSRGARGSAANGAVAS